MSARPPYAVLPDRPFWGRGYAGGCTAAPTRVGVEVEAERTLPGVVEKCVGRFGGQRDGVLRSWTRGETTCATATATRSRLRSTVKRSADRTATSPAGRSAPVHSGVVRGRRSRRRSVGAVNRSGRRQHSGGAAGDWDRDGTRLDVYRPRVDAPAGPW